ncbi:MAG: hypothetical protein HKN18_16445 [Silicimonas sp.]|nr:hypothetical protein [Silicimonas sp.]
MTEAHRVEVGAGARVASKSLEERIAELEAAVGGGNEEFEPDGSEDQAQHRPDRIVYTRPPSSEEESQARGSTLRLSQIALINTGPANDDEQLDEEAPRFRHDAEADAESEPDPDEAPMAVDVPLPEPTSAEVAAFTDPDDVARLIEQRMNSDDEPVQPIAAKGPDADDTDEPSISDEDFEDALCEAVANSLPGAVADTIDAGEFEDEAEENVDSGDGGDTNEDIEETHDTVDSEFESEPFDDADLTEAEDPVPDLTTDLQVDAPFGAPPETALVEADEQPSFADPTPEPTDEEATFDPDAANDDSAEVAAALAELPDDDAMRLLVARLIREELQGELGERITRNVRKLVRREIKRSLSSQDLT